MSVVDFVRQAIFFNQVFSNLHSLTENFILATCQGVFVIRISSAKFSRSNMYVQSFLGVCWAKVGYASWQNYFFIVVAKVSVHHCGESFPNWALRWLDYVSLSVAEHLIKCPPRLYSIYPVTNPKLPLSLQKKVSNLPVCLSLSR